MKSIADIIKSNLTACKDSIIANHIAAGQIASGKTSGLLEVKNVSMMGGELWGFQYYQVWQTGRKAGKWPPRSVIQEWVETKLGKTGKEAASIAFLIQRKIGLEGSKLHREGGRKDIFTPPFERLSENLANELGEMLIETIQTKK